MPKPTIDLVELRKLQAFLTPHELQQLDGLISHGPVWVPQPGPQTAAYYSDADILGYGGAAGGGKTELAIGLCLTSHRRSIILRDESKQLLAITDRIAEILGGRDGYSSQAAVWRYRDHSSGARLDRQIEFGGLKDLGSEMGYQGRPHDLIVFDESTNIRERQVRFLLGWLRSVHAGQRKRCLMTFNPPTDERGRWIIRYFGPWLDKNHPNPAAPGELRWYATVDGDDVERRDGTPFRHDGELITPLSRTFIPSRVADNVFLARTNYLSVLQGLPEPLRSQMLHGDFTAGMRDADFQVIPSAWVDAAMSRWSPAEPVPPMDSMGVDVARGGKDAAVICRKHGAWFAELIEIPGEMIPDGPALSGRVVMHRRDGAWIWVDAIGVGSSVVDHLADIDVLPFFGSRASGYRVQQGQLGFANLRSEMYWRMRELLDPANNSGVMLPQDGLLREELIAPAFRVGSRGETGMTISITTKEDVVSTLGRSPDRADALCMANMPVPPRRLPGAAPQTAVSDYDPYK